MLKRVIHECKIIIIKKKISLINIGTGILSCLTLILIKEICNKICHTVNTTED